MRFIAHYLWNPDEKIASPSHGLPAHVQEFLERGG
jgi:hypothetical protein